MGQWHRPGIIVFTLRPIEKGVAALREAGWGFSAGTFGELVFGEIDRTAFLITLPIPWGTRASFFYDPKAPLEVWPAHRRKARRAVEILLESWGNPGGGTLVVQSALPIGKGMASSSADIVAACRSVAAALGRKISSAEIAKMSSQIEPTDGIMFGVVVAFDPVHGVLLERLGSAPPAMIVGILGHGRINTEDHHRRRDPYQPEQQQRLKEALALAREGIFRRDVTRLGQAGRISAEVEQERDDDDSIAELLAIATAEDTGVIIAHSGTVRGLLVPTTTTRGALHRLEQRLRALDGGPVYRIPVGGLPPQSVSGRGLWPSLHRPNQDLDCHTVSEGCSEPV